MTGKNIEADMARTISEEDIYIYGLYICSFPKKCTQAPGAPSTTTRLISVFHATHVCGEKDPIIFANAPLLQIVTTNMPLLETEVTFSTSPIERVSLIIKNEN
jgi:hypothetical protein